MSKKALSRSNSEGSRDLFATQNSEQSEQFNLESSDSESESQSSEGIPPNQEYAKRRLEEANIRSPELNTQLDKNPSFESQSLKQIPETPKSQISKNPQEKRKLVAEATEQDLPQRKPQYDFPQLGESPSSSPKNPQSRAPFTQHHDPSANFYQAK